MSNMLGVELIFKSYTIISLIVTTTKVENWSSVTRNYFAKSSINYANFMNLPQEVL
jgi:hypothetical protein